MKGLNSQLTLFSTLQIAGTDVLRCGLPLSRHLSSDVNFFCGVSVFNQIQLKVVQSATPSENMIGMALRLVTQSSF